MMSTKVIPFCFKHYASFLVVPVIMLMLSQAAKAQSSAGLVEFELSQSETTIGSPVYLTIDFSRDVQQYSSPKLPMVKGLRFTVIRTPSTIARPSMTLRDWRYVIEIRAEQTGTFTIPPVIVQANRNNLSTPQYVLKVNEALKSPDFTAEIVNAGSVGYIGEPVTLTLLIRIKALYNERRRQYMSRQFMWQQIEWRYSELGLFHEILQRQRGRPNRNKMLSERQPDGTVHVYYQYEVDVRYIPKKEGRVEIEPVKLLMKYPLAIEYLNNYDRRGQLPEVTKSSYFSANTGIKWIEVKPIPLEGRPEYFNGAVGTYEVKTTANPLSLSVGDPITLNYFVSGNGPPPALHRIESFTKDFMVSSDPPAGHQVRGGKIYQFKIVPQHEEVESIPPLPYSSFNTRLEEYRTVYTQPIPIEVKAAVNLDLSELIQDQETAMPSQWAMNQRWSFDRRGLGLIYDWTGDRVIFWTMLIIAILVGLTTGIVYFLIGRPVENEKKLRKQAERNALKKIRYDSDVATLSHDLMAYARLRLNLPSGTGRNEILERLEGLKMPDEELQLLRQILEEGRSESYMPVQGQSAEGLKQKTMQVVQALGNLSIQQEMKGAH